MKKNIDTMYILTGQDTELYFPSKRVRHIAINDNVDTSNGDNELALQTKIKPPESLFKRFIWWR